MTTTHTPRVPPDVIANVQQRWPAIAGAWAAQVEPELRKLCDRYDAIPTQVLSARYGFVVAADTPNGPIVLRSSPDPHGFEQAAVATALACLGIAPAVHETITADHGTWTVLDQVQPGTPIAAADPSTITLDSLFSPMAAMNGQPAPITGMPSIAEWLRSRLQCDHLADLRPGTTVAPADERRIALDVLDSLANDLLPQLCHGDASLRNILADGQSGWKFIDPRGMTGEAAYDVAVLGTRVARYRPFQDLAPLLATAAQVDSKRVCAWMTVAEAARV
jgi:streptomycin 6-kinase